MPKLNQILAVEKGQKNEAETKFTKLYQLIQKRDLMDGLSRTYQPKDDSGETQPPETKIVQNRVTDILNEIAEVMTPLMDITATKDVANTTAFANIVVDGVTLIEKVPTTYLLFLEKKIVDLQNLLKVIPVLDPSEQWHYDEASRANATQPTESTSKKNVAKVITLAPATAEHPAQAQVVTEAVTVGTWRSVRYSGALSSEALSDLQKKLTKLSKAVKFAREEANSTEVVHQVVGGKIFEYLLS